MEARLYGKLIVKRIHLKPYGIQSIDTYDYSEGEDGFLLSQEQFLQDYRTNPAAAQALSYVDARTGFNPTIAPKFTGSNTLTLFLQMFLET